MTIEDTLASMDASLKTIITILQSATSGAAAVGAPAPAPAADAKAKKAAADKAKKDADDAAKNAAAGATGSAANAQGQAAGATGGQKEDSKTDGPSFQDVIAAATLLAKKKLDTDKIDGRSAVVGLFEKWGVKTFPEAQGKKPNAELMADVIAAGTPAAAAEEDPLAGLGL